VTEEEKVRKSLESADKSHSKGSQSTKRNAEDDGSTMEGPAYILQNNGELFAFFPFQFDLDTRNF
jgi:hypothetical protein